MKVYFCGGAGEVGASCVLIKIGGKNLVLDSGIRMGGTKDHLPDMRLIQENGGADAILISHAHMDHTGSLPILSREYPNAKIFMTHATKDLIRVLLYDSLKIMENREEEIPMYAEIHVKNALDRILCFSPSYTFYPFDNNIAVTFYNAGHIAGAVSIYITCNEGSAFYSGDFSVSSQRTVEGASIPRLKPDVAIFESTYGDRLHSSRDVEEERLIRKVKEVITSGKKIIIPAFALGRAQEIILILKKAINTGKLPSFKIYIDGMVNDICRVYKLNPNYLRNQLAKKLFKENDIFYDDNIIAVTGRNPQREEIISKNEGCCIISSSGMLTGGPSKWYVEKLAGDENNHIALTGYQDEESPGRQLLEITDLPIGEDRILKLGDSTLNVKCGIGKYGLSAHADKTEIVSLVHSLAAHKVFFVHGNNQVVASLAQEVQMEYRGTVFAPQNGEIHEIKVGSPRKQFLREKIKTLGKTTTPSEKDISYLWDFITSNYKNTIGFTLEELLYCWTGSDQFDEEEYTTFKKLINSSKYFEPEMRRPFIFHAVDHDTIAKSESEKYMEVNKMLALADTYFQSETGLYKKGAKTDEKITLLYFNFPLVAAAKYTDKFSDFEAETGWKVIVNSECNISGAQNLITKLFGVNSNVIDKISYFVNENSFKVRISNNITNLDTITIQAEFKNTTAIDLIIENKENNNLPQNKNAQSQEFQVEQNKALSLIQEAFNNQSDKLYKKSLKVLNNQSFIELSFISPFIGEKYRELIDDLEIQLRWSIKINQTPNQMEISKIGKKIIEDNGMILKKNLSYIPKDVQVVAYLQNKDEVLLKNIETEFTRITGLTIVFSD